jgi:hypothetical protein
LRREGREHLRVRRVEQDDVLLGREVPEEGARRDLGGGGDLLDGRDVVALRLEQSQGMLLDGGARLGLLALA